MSAVDWCFFLPLFFFSWYSIFLCMELLAVASGIELLAAASGRDEFSSCPTVSLLSTCIVPSGPGPHRHGGSAAAEAAPGAYAWATASADDYRKSGWYKPHIEHLLPMNNNFHISYVCFVNGRVRSPSRRDNEQVLAPTHRRMMPTDRSASTRGEQ